MFPKNQNKDEYTRRIDGHPPPIVVEVRERSHRHWLFLAILLIAVGAPFVWGIWSRVSARTTRRAEPAQAALPAVSVVSPKQTAPAQEIVLPGNVQPLLTSRIYARPYSYLR